jgi:hypothetical protein
VFHQANSAFAAQWTFLSMHLLPAGRKTEKSSINVNFHKMFNVLTFTEKSLCISNEKHSHGIFTSVWNQILERSFKFIKVSLQSQRLFFPPMNYFCQPFFSGV